MRYKKLAGLSFLATVLWAAFAAAGDNRKTPLPPEIARLSKNLHVQISLAYRFNHRAYDARVQAVSRVLRAWRASERLPEDDERLAIWLREAIQSSAPGRRGPLLPAPAFRRPDLVIRVASPPSRSTTVVAPRVEAIARSAAEIPDRVALRHLGSVPAVAFTLPPMEGNALTRDGTPKLSGVIQAASKKTAVPSVTSRHAAVESTLVNVTPSVFINREELFSRIAGYEHGLRRIEARLVAVETPSAQKLARLAQELEALAEQRDLLELYRNAFNNNAAATKAASLRTTETTWRQVSRSIAARRRVLSGTGLLPSEKERQVELSILAAMERRMAEVAAEE